MRMGVRATGSAPTPPRLASGRTGPWRRKLWALPLPPLADADPPPTGDGVDAELHASVEEDFWRPGEVSCGVGALSLSASESTATASVPGEIMTGEVMDGAAASSGEPDALSTRAESGGGVASDAVSGSEDASAPLEYEPRLGLGGLWLGGLWLGGGASRETRMRRSRVSLPHCSCAPKADAREAITSCRCWALLGGSRCPHPPEAIGLAPVGLTIVSKRPRMACLVALGGARASPDAGAGEGVSRDAPSVLSELSGVVMSTTGGCSCASCIELAAPSDTSSAEPSERVRGPRLAGPCEKEAVLTCDEERRSGSIGDDHHLGWVGVAGFFPS